MRQRANNVQIERSGISSNILIHLNLKLRHRGSRGLKRKLVSKSFVYIWIEESTDFTTTMVEFSVKAACQSTTTSCSPSL